VPEPMPYGKVLVVDDVVTNLFVAQGLLAFYELSVETCRSGREAVEKIEQGNVYDIVFMDHLMPDLNGVEAMIMMRDLGYKHPIVALTANALVGQAEEFIAKGFDGFASKPIQTVELNEILIKFIRDKQLPEVIAAANAGRQKHSSPGDIDEFMNSEGVAEKLRKEFMLSNKNSFAVISSALEKGDTKTAHRLAHTIKSAAGLIGEDFLAEIAAEAEIPLKNGKMPTATVLSDLESELNRVLESIQIPELVFQSGNQDKESVEALFDRLEPLLENLDTRCLKLLPELQTIPQAAILVRQMEDYDFSLASKSLRSLRKVLNV